MPLPNPVNIGDTVEWYNTHAIDRREQKNANGEYVYVLYERTPTGLELIDGVEAVDEVVQAMNAYVDIVPKQHVKTHGTHPITSEQTLFPFVWVPVAEGTRDEMLARLEQELN